MRGTGTESGADCNGTEPFGALSVASIEVPTIKE